MVSLNVESCVMLSSIQLSQHAMSGCGLLQHTLFLTRRRPIAAHASIIVVVVLYSAKGKVSRSGHERLADSENFAYIGLLVRHVAVTF